MSPRLFLAEDHLLRLEKVRTLVSRVGRVRVIGTAHDGLSAVE